MSFLYSTSVVLLSVINVCFGKPSDWLITDLNLFPSVELSSCNYNGFQCIQLSNSLISRKFIISPNFFTIEYNSYLISSKQPQYVIRSPFSPEAIIGFNYKNYSIGGISYINNNNITSAFWDSSFLNKNNIKINSTTWIFENYSISKQCNKMYDWTPGTRGSFKYIPWPPKGLQLNVTFKAPLTAPQIIQDNIKITIQYEMYQGMPILSKQIFIESINPIATQNIYLTYIQVEQLKTNIPYGVGEQDWDWGNSGTSMVPFPGKLWLQVDIPKAANIKWFSDSDKEMFKSNNFGGYEPTVITYYGINNQQTQWAVRLAPELPGTYNGIFKSFRTFELFFDNNDLERQGLARRRLMSYMSPTLTEAPVYTQTINMSNDSLYYMIDQCYQTGFEILAFSFDSGFNMETTNQSTLDYYKSIIEYANSLNIEIGGYDLIDMARNVTIYNHMEVNGDSSDGACFASEWVDELTQFFNNFIDYCGGTMFITDGPYPGFSCASTEHKYHDNLDDSVFRQTIMQNEFYLYYRNKGIYIHSPDSYYYFGINKNKYPYNEHTTTLPRWWDLTIYRQLMYDNSYIIPVTAGWMFLPMTPYHNGGQDAVFEPVNQHINDYSFALGQYFSYAVAATIRGNELYDNNATRDVVRNWVNYYKKYRSILISDIIHIVRPNNINIDAILHVNHMLNPCGMLIIFNPLNETIKNESLDINLYYTGAKNSIFIKYQEAKTYNKITLYDEYYYTLNFNVSPRNLTYYLFNCSA